MKKYINHNFFWSSLIVEQLYRFGVKHACVSPGSRNTSLTFALASNKKVKKYIHADERSSGFFALGIAKKLNEPVAIFTTSGTAVAELYPAIIEAYQQRVPLIVCTADRPQYLRNVGANQTINQDNIFSNHIRFYSDLGLPSTSKESLRKLIRKIKNGFCISTITDKGPIHFNIPFEKPFEPTTITKEVKFNINQFIKKKDCIHKIKPISNLRLNSLFKALQNSRKGIIYVGWEDFSEKINKEILSFSKKYNLPLFTDGTSSLRYFKDENKTIIKNHTAFIEKYLNKVDLIIQFGNAPTSQFMLNFMNKTNARKFLVNKYGDLKDPSRIKGEILTIGVEEFLDICKVKLKNGKIRTNWVDDLNKIDSNCEIIKNRIINNSFFGSEPRLVTEILKFIPENSNLFLSNSMVVRDFDYFASSNKNINIFANRGASGIDGLISTASGIAAHSQKQTYLVIGDLAFYHNLSAISTLNEYSIPLIIILVNNNGGGIFNMLPVAKNNIHFKKYWRTPQKINFAKIVSAFGIDFYKVKSWKELNLKFNSLHNSKKFVIEIKTDAKKSMELRRKYWEKINKEFS